MNTGKWKRWTSVLVIMILIVSGLVPYAAAYDEYTVITEETETEIIEDETGDAEALPEEEVDEAEAILTDETEVWNDEDPAEEPADAIVDSPVTEEEITEDSTLTTEDIAEVEADTADEPEEEIIEPETELDTETAVTDDEESLDEEQLEEIEITAEDFSPLNLLMSTMAGRGLTLMAAASNPRTLSDDNYNLKYIINSGYQFMAFENANVNGTHAMGNVLVKGNLTMNTNIADSPYCVAPGFVNGKVNINGDYVRFNSRSQNAPPVLYVGSSNNVTNSGKTLNGKNPYGTGFNNNGVVEVNDNYIDWSKMESTMQSLSTTLAESSTRNYNPSDRYDGMSINAGSSVTFTSYGQTQMRLNVTGSSNKVTVVTIPDSGEVYVPKLVSYNGRTLSDGEETAQFIDDIPVIFNFPNASKVIINSGWASPIGHILAPNSDVLVDGGNYTGTVICKNFTANGSEGHLRTCNADIPEPSNKTYDIQVSKTDKKTGNGLSGAVLAILDSTTNEEITRFTTDVSAKTVSLENGTYILKEISAPNGFLTAAPIYFKVENGKVYLNGSSKPETTAMITMVDDRNSVNPPKATLLIWKTINADGVNSKNDVTISDNDIYFVVEGPNGYHKEIQYSDFHEQYGGREYELKDLLEGSYTVTEYNAKEPGYKHEIVYHAISDYDTNSVPSTAVTEGNEIDVQYHSNGHVSKMWLDNKYTKVDYKFRKVDINGTQIADAQLKIQKKDTDGTYTDVESWTSSASESHTAGNLADGEYRFMEIAAPNGYKVAPEIEFTIDNGQMYVNGEAVSENTLTMEDEYQLSVRIRKIDPQGNLLPGAELEIQDVNGKIVGEPFTTDDMVKTINLDYAGQYRLVEKTAPDGYKKADDIVFYVDRDRTVWVNGKSVEDLTITMEDEFAPLEVELKAYKTLKNGTLAGDDFSFTLTGLSREVSTTEIQKGEGHWETKTVPGGWVEAPSQNYWDHQNCKKNGIECKWVGSFWYGRWMHKVSDHAESVWVEGEDQEVTVTKTVTSPMPTGTEENPYTVKNDEDGNISFGTIVFTEEGIFEYGIAEVVDDSNNQIVYDTRKYKAVVTVTKETNGRLKATVVYQSAEDGSVLNPDSDSENVSADGSPIFINISDRKPDLRLVKVNARNEQMDAELYAQVHFAVNYSALDGTGETVFMEDATLSVEDDGFGYLYLNSLKPGYYTITETVAPEGYMKLPRPEVIKVDEDYNIKIVVQGAEGNEESEVTGDFYVTLVGNGDVVNENTIDCLASDQDKILLVRNYPNIDMPETGRNSRWYCFLFGSLITLAGIILLFTGRGNRKTPDLEGSAGGGFRA